MSRLKLAELTSGIGALVLGLGLGAMFAQWFTPAAGLIVLAGASAHAFGMWDKHRLSVRAAVRMDGGWPPCIGSAGSCSQVSSCS
jgi:hypothetical protein